MVVSLVKYPIFPPNVMQMRGRYYVCASALSVYFLECARLRDSSLLVCEPNYYVNKVQVYGSGIGD
jgi:hypothetical protein